MGCRCVTRGRAARSNDTAPLVVHSWLVSGSGSRPLNTWAVIIDLIDPIDRRLKVGVLYPLRPREPQEPTQPAEAVLHHHDFSAAASAGLRTNPPAGGPRHAAQGYPHQAWWADQSDHAWPHIRQPITDERMRRRARSGSRHP
jgi:hypothetical protein